MVLTRNQRTRMMARMVLNTNRRDVDGVDRLSELPDPLIYHIFSFIDTKYMVKSCVLSKRYKFLWRSLNIFRFDERIYRNNIFFVNFIKEVLSRCVGSKISSFSLEFLFSPNRRFLKKVLKHVLLHKTQHLLLNIGLGDYFSMHPIITSQSLKTLHAPCGSINGSHTFNFPILTTLYLEHPIFDDPDCGFSELFSGCPNLKDLTLHSCVSDLDSISIMSKQLEKLDISVQLCPIDFEIVIDGPKLYSLKYKGDAFVRILANVPSIEKVDLSCFVRHGGNWKERVLNVIEMLQNFQHSKYLKLGSGIMQVLVSSSVFQKQFPLQLCNLKLLELNLPNGYNGRIDVISYLLRHSPAKDLVGMKLWEDILGLEGNQESTYFIDQQPHKIKVMEKGKYHIQLKVNYQLIQGWNSMYTKL
ncbi:putative F-box/LRR-repeat protein At3g18150 [Impatiens glandulifera]|uniref:putative F-box/LRR-repeat protein At3g18150 n=1 Tax=Impatiens glandulifera TaxID=253017 RepID=UPI001FB15B87|nr:putative F-box/LRR-repeat protein At3g18150 [Impatiens glandulifera]